MRLRLTFIREEERISLPIHHNEILQGIVYNHLDPQLAEQIHTRGIKDPESHRGLKLFTFSRLLSAKKPILEREKKKITFSFPLTWIVASPIKEFIISLYNNLIRHQTIYIPSTDSSKKQVLQINHIWLTPSPVFKQPVLVETLSPITVYRTVEKNGKPLTYYFSPLEPEFNELILLNLQRKYRTLTGKNIPIDNAYIKPVKVANRENIIYFKNTIIKGWSGIFEISLPEELFPIAFSCGLGAKNSQGFGCIGIWRGKL